MKVAVTWFDNSPIILVVTLILLGVGIAQQIFVVVFGRRVLGEWIEANKHVDWVERAAAPHPITTVALLAGLNEELVIADTIRALMTQGISLVVFVDDGSDDNTSQVAKDAVDEENSHRVLVARRELPNARIGKGPALNFGFEAINAWVERQGLDPANVVVAVMDADGQLSPGAIAQVRDLFLDPEVGGAQLPVSIRNSQTTLTRIQDIEFWGISALAQIARAATGSVSLGGNGQFTRLSALHGLNRDPWSACLTEDLDLAVALAKRGWRLTTAPAAYVSQQAVESVRRLVKQRTRWYQGHIDCNRHLPDIWRSTVMRDSARLELTYYLLVPIFMVLPWSVLYTYSFIQGIMRLVEDPHTTVFGSGLIARILAFLPWYLLTGVPNYVAAFVYHKRRNYPLWRCVLLCQALLLFQFVTFVACWRAFFRQIARREGWVKTARVAETGGTDRPATSDEPSFGKAA